MQVYHRLSNSRSSTLLPCACMYASQHVCMFVFVLFFFFFIFVFVFFCFFFVSVFFVFCFFCVVSAFFVFVFIFCCVFFVVIVVFVGVCFSASPSCPYYFSAPSLKLVEAGWVEAG